MRKARGLEMAARPTEAVQVGAFRLGVARAWKPDVFVKTLAAFAYGLLTRWSSKTEAQTNEDVVIRLCRAAGACGRFRRIAGVRKRRKKL
jgi:hypothetical protein